ncbi:hypothetical protein BDK51DRAFT_31657, partial [Blyttiomyces helicus]
MGPAEQPAASLAAAAASFNTRAPPVDLPLSSLAHNNHLHHTTPHPPSLPGTPPPPPLVKVVDPAYVHGRWASPPPAASFGTADSAVDFFTAPAQKPSSLPDPQTSSLSASLPAASKSPPLVASAPFPSYSKTTTAPFSTRNLEFLNYNSLDFIRPDPQRRDPPATRYLRLKQKYLDGKMPGAKSVVPGDLNDVPASPAPSAGANAFPSQKNPSTSTLTAGLAAAVAALSSQPSPLLDTPGSPASKTPKEYVPYLRESVAGSSSSLASALRASMADTRPPPSTAAVPRVQPAPAPRKAAGLRAEPPLPRAESAAKNQSLPMSIPATSHHHHHHRSRPASPPSTGSSASESPIPNLPQTESLSTTSSTSDLTPSSSPSHPIPHPSPAAELLSPAALEPPTPAPTLHVRAKSNSGIINPTPDRFGIVDRNIGRRHSLSVSIRRRVSADSSPVTTSSYSTLTPSPAVSFLSQLAECNQTNSPGDYLLGREIGSGTFSRVFMATPLSGPNQDLGRVAIKIVKKDQTEQDTCDSVQRIIDHETTLWARLDHPNVIRMLDLMHADDAVFV